MKLSLRASLLSGLMAVITITSLYSTFLGARLVRRSIVPRIQDKVRQDFAVAREILYAEMHEVENIVRLTAGRLFLAEAVATGNLGDAEEQIGRIRAEEHLDALTLVGRDGSVLIRARNAAEKGANTAFAGPVGKVLAGKRTVSSVEICPAGELKKEAEELAARARTALVVTPRSPQVADAVIDSGLVLVAAAPVENNAGEVLAVLYGFRLVNRGGLAEQMARRIYWGEAYRGMAIGVASVFQGAIRVATTVRMENGQDAIGTVASEEVVNAVLRDHKKWTDRAFAVNDWYITAYEPLKNLEGEVIGMLGIGMLESRFKDAEYEAMFLFLVVTVAEILCALFVCILLVRAIAGPVESLIAATKRVAAGDYTAVTTRRRAPSEIQALAQAFNSMAASIKERDEKLLRQTQQEVMNAERLAMIGRLAAGVAHEINNPLGSILLFTRLILQKTPQEGVMRENLERIEKETKRCHGIVQGLLNFARPREPKVETVDLNGLLDKTMQLFQNQPLYQNVEIIKHYDTGLPAIKADPSQVMQVFVNILMNAVDAMNGNGQMDISTRFLRESAAAEVVFKDTGCGIPADALDKIFEPFYTTKKAGQGTGLGLSISYGIVQRHGGSIRVESEVDKGSSFFITLPVAGETN